MRERAPVLTYPVLSASLSYHCVIMRLDLLDMEGRHANMHSIS